MILMFRRTGTIRVLQWLLLGSFLVSMSGCFLGYLPNYPGSAVCEGVGDVQVRWVFNSFTVCPVDADSISVELIDSRDEAVTPEGGATVSCLDREFVLRAVSCGDYTLRVRAVDEFGDTSWVGDELVVQILGDRVNPLTVNLQVAP